jgi:hypothetical protein
MTYEVTLKLEINSGFSKDRVERQIKSLFQWGTVKESFADGLHILDDPDLISVNVTERRSVDLPFLN